MSHEEFLKQQFGKEQSFKVPEGYFENFANQFMSQLPEHEAREIQLRPNRWHQLRLWAAAAAFVGVAAIGATWWFSRSEQSQMNSFADMNQQLKVEYTLDEAADYAMLDNEEMYAMMAFE